MRSILAIPIAVVLLFACAARGEDAAELRAQGIQALNESQTIPSKIVEAARFFVKAEELYAKAGDEEKAVEMNSFLYWCKKKMTLEDINRFTAGGEAAVAVKLKAVEELAPKVEDAQVWFERAEKFARGNPEQHFLIAVRYFEVASRFKGSDISIKAQELSLNEQALANNQKPAQPVVPAKPVVDTATLRAVPAAEKLSAAEKLIKDLLKADYANADAAGRIALYGKLLQQADENKSDAAAEYVLLREARDAAVLAGDGARAIQAQGRLKGAFKIDAAALNLELQRLAKSARSAEAAGAMAMLLASIGDEALAAENYEQAVRVYLQAEEMLPLVKDAAFKAKLKSDSARVQTLKRESVAAAAALKTLAEKPADPAANLVAGKFMLLRGDLERGFALLAKSGDAQWSALGKHEQAPPTDAEMQVLLGDEWFERVEKETGLMKERVQERAKYWYEAALPNLAGLGKLKIEAQLKKLAGEPATPVAVKTNSPSAPVIVGNLKNQLMLDLGKGVTMELLLIPAGTFVMGSPPSELKRGGEEAQHSVTISNPFYMGKFAVTQDQYKAIIGENPSEHKGGKLPVERVTWPEALKFCEVLSQRAGAKVTLPTEAQWEYACRAGTKTPFYFGETISTDQANYNGEDAYGNGAKGQIRKGPMPVGSFKPNPFGLYDMHGNTWQWCKDFKGNYPGGAQTDPEGPAQGNQHVIRGGSFANAPWDARSAARGGTETDNRLGHLGFRVVVLVTISSAELKTPVPVARTNAPTTAAFAANATDPITKSGFTLGEGKFYQINVTGGWTDGDSKPAGLQARVGVSDNEFDSYGGLNWWSMPAKGVTFLSPPAEGELYLRMKGKKDNITGRRGKLDVTIAEIPNFKWPNATTIDVACLYGGGWNGKDQPQVDFIFTKEGLRLDPVGGAKVFAPIRLNGVVVWLNGGKVAPLDFMEPLLRRKLSLKKNTGDVTITEAVPGEKLTVRVVGSYSSFILGP